MTSIAHQSVTTIWILHKLTTDRASARMGTWYETGPISLFSYTLINETVIHNLSDPIHPLVINQSEGTKNWARIEWRFSENCTKPERNLSEKTDTPRAGSLKSSRIGRKIRWSLSWREENSSVSRTNTKWLPVQVTANVWLHSHAYIVTLTLILLFIGLPSLTSYGQDDYNIFIKMCHPSYSL